jgi:hypothetical protein
VSFIQDIVAEHLELIRTAAADVSKPDLSTCKTKFVNFKNDTIVLLNNLDEVLLFISTKYKKL